ncbi:MAG: response regulator [Faecousia sp.]
MTILAVDDEKMALEALSDAIREAAPEAELHRFRWSEDALAFAKMTRVDVAFLDVAMPDINGVQLARYLALFQPQMNIIFVTGYGQYRDSAFDLHASGYLMKPITAEKVRVELNHLRYPVRPKRRVQVQTFGNFEAFLDGRPMEFKYRKTKELLAYLVDRKGALCTVGEMMSILFEEDQGHETYFKSLRRDLLDTLEAAGCREVVSQQRGRLGVVPEQIDCDYFDYLNDVGRGKAAYRGEYMTQYSWGEYTHGLLEMQAVKA